MTYRLKAAMLLGSCLFIHTAAQACMPIAIYRPTLPAGLDGKLPVTYPVVVPAPTATPNPYGCENVSTYGNTANMPSLSNAETDLLYASVPPTPTPIGTTSTPPATPAWDSARTYNAGDVVSHDGRTYTAKWWAQNETPGTAWGPWEAQQGGGMLAWNANSVYNTGDKISFNGQLYRAKWWTQGNEPNADWGVWENLGVMPTPQPTATPVPTPKSSATPHPIAAVYNAQGAKELYPMPLVWSRSSRPEGFSTRVIQEGDLLKVEYRSYVPYPVTDYVVNAQCGVDAKSAGMSAPAESGSALPPERWEIRMDGNVVAAVSANQFFLNQPRPVATPPSTHQLKPALNPDGTCSKAAGTVILSYRHDSGIGMNVGTVIARGNGNYMDRNSKDNFLSTWACNGDLCRPSTLLWHSRMGSPIFNSIN